MTEPLEPGALVWRTTPSGGHAATVHEDRGDRVRITWGHTYGNHYAATVKRSALRRMHSPGLRTEAYERRVAEIRAQNERAVKP